jgi:hypothetical protein
MYSAWAGSLNFEIRYMDDITLSDKNSKNIGKFDKICENVLNFIFCK